MADVTPSGPFGATLQNAAILLADSADFRTLTGTATQAAALGYIHKMTDLIANWTQPAALVYFGDDTNLPRVSYGDGDGYSAHINGSIMIRFEIGENATYAADPENAVLYFMQQCFDIIDDLAALAGTDEYLSVDNFRPVGQPEVVDESDGEGATYYVWVWALGLDSGS